MSEEKTGMIKICGLWKQEGKGEEGKAFYSGSWTYSTNILLFPNSYKQPGDKNPDLILYIAPKPKKEEKPQTQEKDPLPDDEVPF